MRPIDVTLLEIAARQHSIVRRDQFLEIGTRDQLKRRLRTGALIRDYEAVYSVAGSERTWEQRELAACFAGAKTTVASCRAAARLQSLPGGADLIEVTTRRHNRWNYPGIIVHESHHLSDLDTMTIDAIPVTRTARTICDLAGLVELGELERRTLDHALLEAVRRNIVDVRSVWRTYERLGGNVRLGGVTIYNALQGFVPPTRKPESAGESLLLTLIREHGFPEPVPQFWLQLPSGEWIRLDYAWASLKIGFEFDPYKFHGDRERYEKNASRTRLMQAMGWDRVTVTDDDLNAGIPESAAALRQLFVRRSA